MTLTLHFQGTGLVPANAGPNQLRGGSMTLGRGEENDIMLPDPDKVVSKRHCVVEDAGGLYSVRDLSTNGTFLNYAKTPLGPTPTPLSNGDILVMGPYELIVEIVEAPKDVIPAPLEEEQVSVGRAEAAPGIDELLDAHPAEETDFLDDLLGSGPAGPPSVDRTDLTDLADGGVLPPLGADGSGLLDPLPDEPLPQGASQSAHNPSVTDHIPTPRPATNLIPEDWVDDDFLKDTPEEAPEPAANVEEIPTPEPEPEPIIPDETLAPTPPTAAPVAAPEPPAPAPTPSPQSADAARGFLEELGAADLSVSDEELAPTLSRMGKVMRTMITGLREILMTRSSIKSEFRIEQTMISAGGNNPLKFSISPEQAIEAMVKPTTKGYLDAPTAADQALNDIKAHEIAMMTGMEAALKGVLAKLDPKELEGQIQTSGGLGSLLKGKKARYWEVYEQMYSQISDQAENDFQELFAKEFARAYQDQLDKLK